MRSAKSSKPSSPLIQRNSRVSLTDQLEGILRHELKKFKQGDRFYTDREVCRKYGISPPVARKVLLRLAGEGLVRREISKGTFVEAAGSADAAVTVPRRIAVFCPMNGYCPHSATVEGIEEICRLKSIDVLIRPNRQEGSVVDLSGMARLVKATLNNADGVIWVGSIVENLERWPTPLTVLAKRLVCVNIYAPTGQVTSVVRDDSASAFALTGHLIECGYRRIGYIGGAEGRASAKARHAGFIQALRAHELKPDASWILPHTNGMTEDAGREAITPWIKQRKIPEALICVTDRMAAAVARELQSAGFKIPGDIAVAGFDNAPSSEMCRPPLTSVDSRFAEIGHVAAKLLMDQLKGDTPSGALHWTPGQLIVRDSTG